MAYVRVIVCLIAAIICGPALAGGVDCGPAGSMVAASEVEPPVARNAQIGTVSIDFVRAFRTRDPRINSFKALSPPGFPIVETASNCLIQIAGPPTSPFSVTVVENPYFHPFTQFRPSRPSLLPSLAGYEYISSAPAKSPEFEWFGIWAAKSGKPKSRIVGFGTRNGAQYCHVLAEFPVRFGLVQGFPGLHGSSHFSLISQAKRGQSIVWLQASYPPSYVVNRKPTQAC